MKLIFTGYKRLEEIAVDQEGEKSSRERRKEEVITRINRLFGNGFRLPLEGMEMPVEFYKNRFAGSYRTCTTVSPPKLEDGDLVLRCDAVYHKFQGEADRFGRRHLALHVLKYLQRRIADDPERKAVYDEIFEGMDENDIRDELIFFMQPEAPRLSGKHVMFFKKDDGSIYVADKGSYTGTWVNGEKLGTEHGKWPHWDDIKPEEVDYDNPDAKFRDAHYVVIYDANGNILLKDDLQKDLRDRLKRVMNYGCVEVKNGAEITLGKDAFGEDYKFVVKVD